jgi:hypothetical protein
MSKILINIPNGSVQIGQFFCTLEEFIAIEPTFKVSQNVIEIECNLDKLQRQCVKGDDGIACEIPAKLQAQLLRYIDNIPRYQNSLTTMRTPRVLTVAELKNSKLSEIKSEAAKRISSSYPHYNQINTLGAVAIIHNNEMLALKNGVSYELSEDEKVTVNKAKVCNEFISFIRKKSNELESLVNEKTLKEELDSVDVSNDIYWA